MRGKKRFFFGGDEMNVGEDETLDIYVYIYYLWYSIYAPWLNKIL